MDSWIESCNHTIQGPSLRQMEGRRKERDIKLHVRHQICVVIVQEFIHLAEKSNDRWMTRRHKKVGRVSGSLLKSQKVCSERSNGQ